MLEWLCPSEGQFRLVWAELHVAAWREDSYEEVSAEPFARNTEPQSHHWGGSCLLSGTLYNVSSDEKCVILDKVHNESKSHTVDELFHHSSVFIISEVHQFVSQAIILAQWLLDWMYYTYCKYSTDVAA